MLMPRPGRSGARREIGRRDDGRQRRFLLDETGAAHIPAVAVEAVDTTGAGDAFTAALAVSLAEGLDLERPPRASLVAAITVTRIGTQSAFPRPNRSRRADGCGLTCDADHPAHLALVSRRSHSRAGGCGSAARPCVRYSAAAGGRQSLRARLSAVHAVRRTVQTRSRRGSSVRRCRPEVVELQPAVLEELHQLPVAGTDRAGRRRPPGALPAPR